MKKIADGNASHEKRIYPRVNARLPVMFKVVQETDRPEEMLKSSNHEESNTQNLSEGGLALVSSKPLSQDQLVVLDVRMPDSTMVKLFAETRWCKQVDATDNSAVYHVGLQFVGFMQDADKAVLEFVKKALSCNADEAPPADKGPTTPVKR